MKATGNFITAAELAEIKRIRQMPLMQVGDVTLNDPQPYIASLLVKYGQSPEKAAIHTGTGEIYVEETS